MPPQLSYREQLLDPRWQKKRLHIFERDEFACMYCHSTDKTLMVHHLLYKSGAMAWEVDDDWLITLCNECHEEYHDAMPIFHKNIIDSFRLKLKDPFIWGCAETFFREADNLHDLIYLLWELRDMEEDIINFLRKKFQKRNNDFIKSLECRESEA